MKKKLSLIKKYKIIFVMLITMQTFKKCLEYNKNRYFFHFNFF